MKFEIGQKFTFKLGVKGRNNVKGRELTVIATGGGNTTFKGQEGGLICLKDEDAEKKITG